MVLSTDCLIVLGIIFLFQIADIIQMRSIQNIVDDITEKINDIKNDLKD